MPLRIPKAKHSLSQAREASSLMSEGGRIVAITYAQGSRDGRPAAVGGHGFGQSSMESLGPLFRGGISPHAALRSTRSVRGGQRNSVLNSLPEQVQDLIRTGTRVAGPR